mmetsp:Transcript_15604/g.22878  ORF Transcript_15604/g.22878 Transcript_15604/m.22878 type:complete len:84 (+) Transcript_15604:224-475(+)
MLTKSLQPLPDKFHGLIDMNKRYRPEVSETGPSSSPSDLFFFRNVSLSTRLNSEFTSIELYQAYADMMLLTEKPVARQLRDPL